MMATNVIVARPAVTLKLAVAVVPPWSTLLDKRVLRRCAAPSDRAAPSTSKIGIKPIAFGAQDEHEERQNERRPGVHPLPPDVRQHDRVAHELDHGLERVHEAGRHRRPASDSGERPGDDAKHEPPRSTASGRAWSPRSRCPKIVGRWISGWSRPLFETCSMIVSPALNLRRGMPAAVPCALHCAAWAASSRAHEPASIPPPETNRRLRQSASIRCSTMN